MPRWTRFFAVFGWTIALSALAASASAQQITGAGSTFVYPVLAKWSAAYSKLTNVRINYQSIGSGAGIAQITAGTVVFGASDMPLDAARLRRTGLAQFPCVIGGIVPVLNLPGIKPGQLRFTGAVLADVYLGKISKWNDPRIAALNAGVALPALAVTVVHRSDSSGTTFNWLTYLSKVSPEWKARVGEGTSVAWPSGIGGKGNEGVAAYVGRIKGSIGYVEYAYVQQNNMIYALVQNRAGQFVAPGTAAFRAAAASADWTHAEDFDLVMTDAPGARAWPITATTFILMRRQPPDEVQSKAALGFFRWAFEHGQALAEQLDYVPLPEPLVRRIEAYWRAAIT